MAGVHIKISTHMVTAVRAEVRTRLGRQVGDADARALIAAALRAGEISMGDEGGPQTVVVHLVENGDQESARVTVGGPGHDFGYVKVQVSSRMTDMPNLYAVVPCPMPDGAALPCGEPLHVRFELYRTLYSGDLVGPAQSMSPNARVAATWVVECSDGHTILLPTEIDVDETEEVREFRDRDADRLRTVMRELNRAGESSTEFHDDRTLDKVYEALTRGGAPYGIAATDPVINDMFTAIRRAGILFRERVPVEGA